VFDHDVSEVRLAHNREGVLVVVSVIDDGGNVDVPHIDVGEVFVFRSDRTLEGPALDPAAFEELVAGVHEAHGEGHQRSVLIHIVLDLGVGGCEDVLQHTLGHVFAACEGIEVILDKRESVLGAGEFLNLCFHRLGHHGVAPCVS